MRMELPRREVIGLADMRDTFDTGHGFEQFLGGAIPIPHRADDNGVQPIDGMRIQFIFPNGHEDVIDLLLCGAGFHYNLHGFVLHIYFQYFTKARIWRSLPSNLRAAQRAQVTRDFLDLLILQGKGRGGV
jgi:hypothetical protein